MNARKILFANTPFDGHFLPLTGIAMKLKEMGHDVRWYSSKMYSDKIARLGILHYKFKRALDLNHFNLDETFPERKKLRHGIQQLKFDLKNCFVYRGEEYFEDIQEIWKEFPFEIIVSDITFIGAELVQKKLSVKNVTVGIMPIIYTSRDLPPAGLALLPNYSPIGVVRDKILRFVSKNFLFKESTNEYNKIMAKYGLGSHNRILFDIPTLIADVFIQSGVPGFEYKRSDLPANVKFVGPLHAYKNNRKKEISYPWVNKIGKFSKTILISQGTVEPDHSKLIIPALEGLKDSDYLLLVTTGYLKTDELRRKYKQENIIIEDFIDFDFIMQKADVFITNGGFGGTLIGIDNSIPMVASGINEGKNEICARIGYFRIGINLNKEKPHPKELRRAVEKILNDGTYKMNISRLRDEFRSYNPAALSASYILETIEN